jgi:hypothetical protein
MCLGTVGVQAIYPAADWLAGLQANLHCTPIWDWRAFIKPHQVDIQNKKKGRKLCK